MRQNSLSQELSWSSCECFPMWAQLYCFNLEASHIFYMLFHTWPPSSSQTFLQPEWLLGTIRPVSWADSEEMEESESSKVLRPKLSRDPAMAHMRNLCFSSSSSFIFFLLDKGINHGALLSAYLLLPISCPLGPECECHGIQCLGHNFENRVACFPPRGALTVNSSRILADQDLPLTTATC